MDGEDDGNDEDGNEPNDSAIEEVGYCGDPLSNR